MVPRQFGEVYGIQRNRHGLKGRRSDTICAAGLIAGTGEDFVKSSRRELLIGGSGALAATVFALGRPSQLFANPLNKPIGLELYTVGAELEKDYDGTLRQIAAIGYKEVETGVSPKRKAADVKKSLQDAGLRCRAM